MTVKKIQRDHARLLANLRLIQKNYSVGALANVLDISQNTWRNRMKEPWKQFSYDDFRTIAKYCGVSFTQLVDGEIKLR